MNWFYTFCQRWTETYVRWSPQGRYLATFHGKGIALWGGPKFEQIMRFSHPGVQLIDFSPCERYLVTFSPLQASGEEPNAIIIWDIRTGQKKRGFHCETQSTWPIFKWVNIQFVPFKSGYICMWKNARVVLWVYIMKHIIFHYFIWQKITRCSLFWGISLTTEFKWYSKSAT